MDTQKLSIVKLMLTLVKSFFLFIFHLLRGGILITEVSSNFDILYPFHPRSGRSKPGVLLIFKINLFIFNETMMNIFNDKRHNFTKNIDILHH